MSEGRRTRLAVLLGTDDRTITVSSGFLLFVFLYERLGLGIDGIAASGWFAGDSYATSLLGAVYVALAVFLFYSFIVITVAAGPIYKIFGILIFAVITLLEYSYFEAIGRTTNFLDVYNAVYVTPEQSRYAAFAFAGSSWILPTVMLTIIAFSVDERAGKFAWRRVGIWTICTVVFYIQLSLIAPRVFGERLSTSGFDAAAQTIVDFLLSRPGPVAERPPRYQLVGIQANASEPKGNIVLVFDESVRPDHLSLNGYARQTTPFLSELSAKKLLVNWGTISSTSTSSVPSYNYFIAGATPDVIQSQSAEEINRMPSIFQYAKAMNYKTFLFDAQMKYYWGGVPDDLRYIDQYINVADFDPNRVEDWQNSGGLNLNPQDNNNTLKQWEFDPIVAARVKEITSNSSGNFIMIYKRGVHFPYEKNYPEGNAKWTPAYRFGSQWEIPSEEFKDQVINSYDNSIANNLDHFFRELADDYRSLPNGTIIVYTSDHGQKFGVPGAAGHGGSSKEEASVPLFMIGLGKLAPDTSFRASHASLFTSLLDLMKVPSDVRAYSYEGSLLTADGKDSRARFYNLIDGRKMPFD